MMDTTRARTILAAWRPELSDFKESDVTQALEQTEQDAELKQWLESEQAFDRAFANKLCSCPAPESLRETILESVQTPNIIPIETSRPRRYLSPMPWGIAACFAVAAFLAAFLLRRPAPGLDEAFAAVQEHVQAQGYTGIQAGDWESIYKTLSTRGAPLPKVLPVKMLEMPGKGCLSFAFQGRIISLICFQDEQRVYHLYIMNLGDLQEKIDISRPKYNRFGAYSSASWTDNKQFYMMVTEGTQENLSELL